MKKTIVLAILLAVAALPAPAQERTVDSIAKALSDQWDKLDSLTAKIELVYCITGNGEIANLQMVVGDLAYLRQYDILYSRVTIVMDGEKGLLLKFKSITNADGAFVETSIVGLSPKSTRYDKPSLINGCIPIGGKPLFDELKKEFKMKALADQPVEGKEAYVLEIEKKKPEQGELVTRIRLWFGKDTALVLKLEAFNASGESVGLFVTKDIEVNPPLTPAEFKYEAPKAQEPQRLFKPAPVQTITPDAQPKTDVAPAEAPPSNPAQPAPGVVYYKDGEKPPEKNPEAIEPAKPAEATPAPVPEAGKAAEPVSEKPAAPPPKEAETQNPAESPAPESGEKK